MNSSSYRQGPSVRLEPWSDRNRCRIVIEREYKPVGGAPAPASLHLFDGRQDHVRARSQRRVKRPGTRSRRQTITAWSG